MANSRAALPPDVRYARAFNTLGGENMADPVFPDGRADLSSLRPRVIAQRSRPSSKGSASGPSTWARTKRPSLTRCSGSGSHWRSPRGEGDGWPSGCSKARPRLSKRVQLLARAAVRPPSGRRPVADRVPVASSRETLAGPRHVRGHLGGGPRACRTPSRRRRQRRRGPTGRGDHHGAALLVPLTSACVFRDLPVAIPPTLSSPRAW